MPGAKGFARALALGVAVLASFSTLQAGTVDHGRITVPDLHEIGGIAFDNDPAHNPLVANDRDGLMWRLNVNDASVLQNYVITNGPIVAHGLEYAGSGTYYQVADQPNRLYTTNVPAGTTTAAPNDFGTNHNFYDLGLNPIDGKLYMLTSDIDVNLYEVNIATGNATLVHAFGELGPTVGAMSALAFGPDGTMFASSLSSTVFQDRIFRLDFATWNFIPVTTLGFSTPDFLTDFTYDASRDKWYGIEEVRTTDPDRQWRLVEITGITSIPEPGGIALLGVAGAGALMRWRSRRQRA